MSWVETKSQYDKINNSVKNIYEFTRRLTREIRTLRDRNDEDLTEEITGLVNERNRLKNLADSSRQEMARLLYYLTPIVEQEEVKDRFDNRIRIINLGHNYDSIQDTVNVIRENRLRYGDAIIYEDMFFIVASRGSCFVMEGINIHNIGHIKFCVLNKDTYLSPMFWNSRGRIVVREIYDLGQFRPIENFDVARERNGLPYRYVFSTVINRENCVIYSMNQPSVRGMIVPLHIEREDDIIHIISGSGNYLYDLENRRVNAMLDGIPNPTTKNTFDTDSESSDSVSSEENSEIEDPMVGEDGLVRQQPDEEADDSGIETDSHVESDFDENEEHSESESDNSQRDFSESDSDSENMD